MCCTLCCTLDEVFAYRFLFNLTLLRNSTEDNSEPSFSHRAVLPVIHRASSGDLNYACQVNSKMNNKIHVDNNILIANLSDEEKAKFSTILNNLNLDRLPSLVSEIQYSGHHSTGIIVPTSAQPIPEISAFESGIGNELGCPFIVMEMVRGRPLYHGWFEEGASQAKLERFRAKALQSIAEAITQLSELKFSQRGSPIFDPDGELKHIGKSKVADLSGFYVALKTNDPSATMPFYQMGPFNNPKSHFLAMLDRRKSDHERIVDQGVENLLRLFIEWSLNDVSTFQARPFVLGHPDFDDQNILVKLDGSLAGIIDWDWESAVPNSLGCQKFPVFLTRDYDPTSHEYDVKAGKPDDDCDSNSPA